VKFLPIFLEWFRTRRSPHYVLQCVAVVAVCCSVLQSVAVGCSHLQSVAMWTICRFLGAVLVLTAKNLSTKMVWGGYD